MPASVPTGFLLKKSNGTKNIFFTQGPRSLLTPVSCLFPCSLYFSLQKSYEIISKSCCRRAHRNPPPRLWGVSVSASVACVPIASAKVRRNTAIRKKNIWKSLKIRLFTGDFGACRLQNIEKQGFLAISDAWKQMRTNRNNTPNIPFPLMLIQKKGMSCKKTRRGQKTKVP